MNKDLMARNLIQEYTPQELAMFVIESEEQRMCEQAEINRLCNENMFLREWCDYLKMLVLDMVNQGKDNKNE